MSIEKEPKSTPDIFEILGIDPNKGVSDKQTETPASAEALSDNEPNDDPNAPSGSIFDNYSTYRDGNQGYWRRFRILTIVGIATFLSLIGLYIYSTTDLSLPSFSGSDSEISFAEETRADRAEMADEGPDSPTAPDFVDQTLYFEGKINGKYSVHMLLDFATNTGRYYYDRSGASNCMYINIIEAYETDGKVYVELDELNSNGEITGVWEGYLSDQTYSGSGTYLGREMPFSLSICRPEETDF